MVTLKNPSQWEKPKNILGLLSTGQPQSFKIPKFLGYILSGLEKKTPTRENLGTLEIPYLLDKKSKKFQNIQRTSTRA